MSLLLVAGAAAPFFLYPIFLMQALCFALFACAFNLLLGYVGLLSFGHAAFFGCAAYVTGHAVKVWGLTAGARASWRALRRRRCSGCSSAGSRSAGRASISR